VREAAGTSPPVTVEKAGDHRDIAGLDIPMQRQMVARAGVVGVRAASAGGVRGSVAGFRNQARRFRVVIQSGLFRAAARSDETTRGFAATHLFAVGTGHEAGSGALQVKTGLRQEARARAGARKAVKNGAPAGLHDGGIENRAKRRLRMGEDAHQVATRTTPHQARNPVAAKM
jgi:hypothetical protein